MTADLWALSLYFSYSQWMRSSLHIVETNYLFDPCDILEAELSELFLISSGFNEFLALFCRFFRLFVRLLQAKKDHEQIYPAGQEGIKLGNATDTTRGMLTLPATVLWHMLQICQERLWVL